MLTEAEATPEAIRDRVRAFLAEHDPAEPVQVASRPQHDQPVTATAI